MKIGPQISGGGMAPCPFSVYGVRTCHPPPTLSPLTRISVQITTMLSTPILGSLSDMLDLRVGLALPIIPFLIGDALLLLQAWVQFSSQLL